MIVGVTGGNGFIGSWVQKSLAKRGHKSLVLDHKNRDGVMLGDVRDETIVHEFAAHVDGIIHLAAVLGTAETIDNPRPAAETNIIGTLNVFEAASRYNLPIVFAAVGNSGIGRGTYCITKACGEEFVRMYREDRGLRITAVRPMNAYGPSQSAPSPYGSSKVRKIVPSFVCSALSGTPMPLYGGGEQVSDAVFVEDVAETFVIALEHAANGNVPHYPIDVGSVRPTRVLDVAKAISKLVPGATIESLPMRAGEPFGGPLDTPDSISPIADSVLAAAPALAPAKVNRVVKQLGTAVYADTSTLKFLGIDANAFTSLETGMQITVDWFRENEGVTWRSPN
jgi:nucleoside-diphosphate-sugar epimerase